MTALTANQILQTLKKKKVSPWATAFRTLTISCFMQYFKKRKKEGSLPLSIQTTLDHNVHNNVSVWSLIPFIGASLRIFAATFISDYTLEFCLLVVLLDGFWSMITLAWKNERLSKYFFSYLEAFEKTWLLSKMFCRSHQWSYENMTIFFCWW